MPLDIKYIIFSFLLWKKKKKWNGVVTVSNGKFEKGKNAIICTADKISVINDGTYILPVSSI